MKKIECIIRPPKLEKVQKALSSVGVRRMTVSEIHRFEHNRRHIRLTGVAPKLKIEVAVAEENVGKVVEAVKQAASNGKINTV